MSHVSLLCKPRPCFWLEFDAPIAAWVSKWHKNINVEKHRQLRFITYPLFFFKWFILPLINSEGFKVWATYPICISRIFRRQQYTTFSNSGAVVESLTAIKVLFCFQLKKAPIQLNWACCPHPIDLEIYQILVLLMNNYLRDQFCVFGQNTIQSKDYKNYLFKFSVNAL